MLWYELMIVIAVYMIAVKLHTMIMKKYAVKLHTMIMKKYAIVLL